MAGEIPIFQPVEVPADVQARRNRELDADTLARLIQNFTAAYNETAEIAADYWARQGQNGVAQVQRFGIWKSVLLSVYADGLPDDLAWVATAGDQLELHQDGTVTVKG